MNGTKVDGAARQHVKRILVSPSRWMLFHSLITARRARGDGSVAGWGRLGVQEECDLRASRSGTDRDGFTVAQA